MAKIELITNWRHAWKMASVWVFIVIGAFPDIYNAVVAAGLHDQLPPMFVNALRILSVVGIGSRIIKQKVLEATHDDERRRNQ